MTEQYGGLPGSDNPPWVEIKKISFRHGEQIVLKDLSLKFHPGRHYILAGPNGAGKSTLMDIMARLKNPYTGHINFMGRDIMEYKPLELARIQALAPQDFKLNFSFTAREVASMGRRPYLERWGRLSKADEEVVERALSSVNLEALAEKPVTAMSGGEKQRVIVARALAQDTPILLLDEPTAGLDVAQALDLMELAKKQAEAGRLVVTVTHDLNLAATFGHEFIFLKKGNLVACGSTADVFTPKVLGRVYEAEVEVSRSSFTGGLYANFRRHQTGKQKENSHDRNIA